MSYFVDSHIMFSYSESLPIIDVASESYHNVTLLRDFDKFPPPQDNI
jgi:hypothetical protein